jgi:hypothetical protein
MGDNLESDDDEHVGVRKAVEESHAIITEIRRKSTGGAAMRSVRASHVGSPYTSFSPKTYVRLLKRCIINETVDFEFYCETTWSEARLRDVVQRLEDKSPSRMIEDTHIS